MNKNKIFPSIVFILCCLLFSIQTLGQDQPQGVIKGRVFDKLNNNNLSGANILIRGSNQGTTTDEEGRFKITGLEPGLYDISVTYVGYKKKTISEIEVSKARPAQLKIGMEETAIEQDAVEIKASPFEKKASSPVSNRNISESQVRRNPGANQDISNVIQSFPGVATTASFRNDLIIRGGAPNENSFYIDGIEVPNINHFATQGATGGPVGLINVDFIRNVDFYTGAFAVNRTNGVSSVLDFNFKDGRTDQTGARFTLGASEVGASVEGPIGDDFSYILSARRSYLQFLFDALGLPFLPTYNDLNFKGKYQIDNSNYLTLIGVGAIDNFSLNTDEDDTEANRYTLNNVPINEQWNYTAGGKFTHFGDNGYYNIVASRYHLKNIATQFEDYKKQEDKILDYESEEIDNQFRFEKITRSGGFKFLYGANYAHSVFKNNTKQAVAIGNRTQTVDFSSNFSVNRYGVFGQVDKGFLNDKIKLSAGVRTYAMDYSDATNNPLDQISPRFSASYQLTDKLSLNFNTGIYHQRPPFTVLGFKDSSGKLANKENGVTYFSSKQVVGGIEYITNTNTKISLEGFYKKYDDYPFLLDDSISLANRGGDFGVVGNAPAEPSSEGRAYGMELLVNQNLYKGFYGVLAYTLVWSEFTDKNGEYVPSAWDNRHIVSLTAGKKFGKNWEIGVKWRFQSGAPYTPYDVRTSSFKEVWRVTKSGVPDYDRLNTKRLSAQHGLDFRIDKKFYFSGFNLDVYFDVQNAYNFQIEGQPYLTVKRDDEGNPIENPNNPRRYQTKRLENSIGTRVPSVGAIFEF